MENIFLKKLHSEISQTTPPLKIKHKPTNPNKIPLAPLTKQQPNLRPPKNHLYQGKAKRNITEVYGVFEIPGSAEVP